MSKRRKTSTSGAMLELWRPPQNAGDPIGCLSTTYTFHPGLFDEQCLGRFLDIESEPDREDLAFLLERESRLGGVYAGVLVDYTQAGVEHSLRWDVLRVRLRSGKQHAKISLLAWNQHVRIIVASANLTETGYRSNHEVTGTVELTPAEHNAEMLAQAMVFLRSLLLRVPGRSEGLPEVRRAEAFMDQVETLCSGWKQTRRRGAIRQRLVFTLPADGVTNSPRSSLEEAIQVCRSRGASPSSALIASPFFDAYDDSGRVTAALCKAMARGARRKLLFCVPAIRDADSAIVPRLAAPRSLLVTPRAYQAAVSVDMLPEIDGDRNRRPWHAKMMALRADAYSALMIGSSNFTCAGMGVKQYRNAEANLLTIVDRTAKSREVGLLNSVWPQMERIADPEAAEWLDARPEIEEEEQAKATPLPAGFLSATYRAGDKRQIILLVDPHLLPEDWDVHATETGQLLSATKWREEGSFTTIELPWGQAQPPAKLLVRWESHEAFLPLNVEDSSALPPPAQLEQMTADDMLGILAAADPSAAFRVWARGQQASSMFDEDLDSATPMDLDPLRRYDLQATFLHRIRRRARILAQLRANLERPVWGKQSLEWRLRGLLGVEPLADRFVREFANPDSAADTSLLTLADFLIVLHEVDYQPAAGSLPRSEFDEEYQTFLGYLASRMGHEIATHNSRVSVELLRFWERVLGECQG
jgi:hypothetical protein